MKVTKRSECVVINRRDEDPSDLDVYIGRGSFWGNPFRIGPDGSRDEVIVKYERYARDNLESGEWDIEDVLRLEGRRLVCYCSPRACHGDVLVKLIEELL